MESREGGRQRSQFFNALVDESCLLKTYIEALTTAVAEAAERINTQILTKCHGFK